MNWIAFVVVLTFMGILSGISAVTVHLFYRNTLISVTSFAVALFSFLLAIPLAIVAGLVFGG